MAARTFHKVTLAAEHIPETHRTLATDGSVTEAELPGTVQVYLVFDGKQFPFATLKGGKVLDAIDAASPQAEPSS